MELEAYYWLMLFIVLIAIEIITMGLTTVWFAGGSLVAFFAALTGINGYVQVVLFLVISLVLLIFTRPLVKKQLLTKREKTNAESLIGREAVVVEPINNLESTGKVRIGDIEWMARTSDSHTQIEKDTVVKILHIEGVKMIVEKGE
jgi:membrane protein implicated in regulation of membrane protease activity